jgi:tripartite-type tricarboxylate transporter receptor subunit TctC
MRINNFKKRIGSIAAAVSLAISSTAAFSQASSTQVEWKKITINLTTSPGGSFDLYARFLSRHMPKHLPGEPAIIIAHRVGSGGMTMTNWLYNVAAKDGSELGMPQRTFPIEPILRKESQARYEANKFNWIGSLNSDVGVLVFWQTPPTLLDDVLSGKPYPVGATGATSDSATFYRVINRLLGANLQVIPAYPSATATVQALESGELRGTAAVSLATLQYAKSDWITTGRVKLLMQMTVARSKLLPDVPSIKELVKEPLDREVIDLILSCQDLGRPLIAPPGMSPERTKILRSALTSTMNDPEAIADAKKMSLLLDYIPGEMADEMLAKIFASRKEAIARAQSVLAD